MLMLQHRTDQTATTKTDLFAYSPSCVVSAAFPSRAGNRFPDNPMTYDDFLGEMLGSSPGG